MGIYSLHLQTGLGLRYRRARLRCRQGIISRHLLRIHVARTTLSCSYVEHGREFAECLGLPSSMGMRRMMPRIECLPSSIAYSENLIGNDCTFIGIVSTAYSTFVC